MLARSCVVVVAVALAVLATSCGAGDGTSVSDPPSAAGPEQRAVHIATTGCGWASGRTGSGVLLEDGIIVTVAHLVIRASAAAATIGDGVSVETVVTAVDLDRDLALLRVQPIGISLAEVAPISPDSDSSGLIVGGAASGNVPFVTKRPARISIEEVLGSARHTRLGYELEAATTRGDSGAGVYDSGDRLLGIVFATSDAGSITWATAVSEVLTFVEENRTLSTPLVCDAESSALRPSD